MRRGDERLAEPARELMAITELSLEKLARLSGVGWTTLSRWRRGENVPHPETARRLARAIRARADEMIGAASALEVAAREIEAEGTRRTPDRGGDNR